MPSQVFISLMGKCEHHICSKNPIKNDLTLIQTMKINISVKSFKIFNLNEEQIYINNKSDSIKCH